MAEKIYLTTNFDPFFSQKRMKHRFAFFLLALFLCQFLAWWLVPWAGLMGVRKLSFSEIGSSKNEVSVFRFLKKDFEKMRFDRREFWHDGMLFDFEKIENLPCDSVLVTAHRDFHEQKFLKKLGKIFSPTDENLPSGGSDFSKQLARFLADHFLPPQNFSFKNFTKNGFQKPFFHFSERLKSRFLKIFEPPPDMV